MYSLYVLNRKIWLYGGILYNNLNALVSSYIIFKSIHVQYVENVDSRKFLNANNSKDGVKGNVLTMKLKFYESKSGNNSNQNTNVVFFSNSCPNSSMFSLRNVLISIIVYLALLLGNKQEVVCKMVL